jgi:hypothetical protein
MLAAGVRAIGAQAPKLDPGMDTVLRRMLASTPHPKKAPTPSGGKMFAHRRVRFEYVALFLVLASVARASPSDVSKPRDLRQRGGGGRKVPSPNDARRPTAGKLDGNAHV